MSQPRPFALKIEDAAIADLKARLRASRVPDSISDESGFNQGIPRADLLMLLDRWSNAYDWRYHEEVINRLPQFTVEIQGFTIHFLHRRSPRLDAIPLIAAHGWPGSFYEFHKVLDPLAAPNNPLDAAFHVVVPSVPGFAFSSKPTKPGFKLNDIASIFAELMTVLGYPRFIAQGGDWGSGVVRALALNYPDRCMAYHLNMAFAPLPLHPTYLPMIPLLAINYDLALAKDDAAALRHLIKFANEETGYYRIQATKPYTLGVGLNDSPVGLLAWLGEKFWSSFGMDEAFIDEILTIVSIYWFTETIASSFRLYKEEIPLNHFHAQYTKQPAAVAIFPREISRPPKKWLEYNHNLVRYAKLKQGGHFAALEVPDLLVGDLRAFVADLRRLRIITIVESDFEEDGTRGTEHPRRYGVVPTTSCFGKFVYYGGDSLILVLLCALVFICANAGLGGW
ncbi:epocide hydrolase domain-containing protein [Zopfochytrium polystomum]|nr:epocide hydrolase domain-containing protein [Zopfochytrium polystomum]